MSHPQVQKDKAVTPLQHAMRVEEEELQHRQARLLLGQTKDDNSVAPDAALPENQQNIALPDNAEFSKKIYLFPEEYNALRRELHDNWQNFFYAVNPAFGFSPAWAMVYDAPHFVGFCNDALDMVVQFDSADVAGTCKKFLNGFRNKRGISSL